MSTGRLRPATLPQSLGRLRLRLTAWYVGTFFAILALLGVGMFAAITRQFDRELDASLRDATTEMIGAARARGPQAALRDLRIPGRTLMLADTLGRSIDGTALEPWIAGATQVALSQGTANASHAASESRLLRAFAQRVRLEDGTSLVAVAVSDEIEIEDRYPALIAAFGAAAFVALVLIAAGGWLLARQSIAPVERNVEHMRRFMADAAHELRTPLTVVRSRAEVALQRARSPEEYVQSLRAIERETERLGGIVEDLLMLARADAGERPLERRPVFLDDLTLDAAESARAIADRKGVRLEVDDFEEARMHGDPTLLRQLVLILLDNAIKFTGAGGVVRVGVRAAGSSATLTVTDTGIGISPEQLTHVFERFYRGDVSRTRAANESGSVGVGLGLSIAQWIAEQHGGSIRIESGSGQGARVTVQFPAEPAGRAAPVAASLSSS
ncbi:MAG TPA: HAMP domain-containing sensor histidine kinase [Gemmatimonadaceae bacterium]|nr:HAMP domain-containing sensor histidine kinase [Gemmatimonadaceae bacterium]